MNLVSRTFQFGVRSSIFANSQKLLASAPWLISSRGLAEQHEKEPSKLPPQPAPSTSTLLKVDWLLQKITPLVLKSNIRDFIEICREDVQFEDRIFSYNVASRSSLMSHIAKVRMYYRYLSPFNKVEWIGSCVYENEDVIVVLWRLSTLESSFWTYFPAFVTKKQANMIVKEGALDIQINEHGHVLRVLNRPITASDREGAKSLAKMKEQFEAERVRQEEKEMRKEFDRQYHS